MRIATMILFITLIYSCKNSTDGAIDRYAAKVDELSEISANKDLQDPALLRIQEEINTLIDQLSTLELSEEQTTRVTGISLKLQAVIMEIENRNAGTRNADLNRIRSGLDSAGRMLEEMDSLTMERN